MTQATFEALYGHHNPFRGNSQLCKDIWTYDAGFFSLVAHPFPQLTSRKTIKARSRIQNALRSYYGNGYDTLPDASKILAERAVALREAGIAAREVGYYEIALANVSTTNSIPTVFWLAVNIVSRPEAVAGIRDEVSRMATFREVEPRRRVATINMALVETHAPFLVSCYRETLRCYNTQIGARRALVDTVLSDGQGSTYLLKEGKDIQMPSAVSHKLLEVWGPDAVLFQGARFVEEAESDIGARKGEEKQKKAAYIPFGGGKHLCPGRNFAFAENLGFVAALVMGFDVIGGAGDEPVSVPKPGPMPLASAVSKPIGGGEDIPALISRRKGWEDVVWDFSI